MRNEKLFVFFGATGNLFSEKIFPAFYHLIRRKKIDHFHILSIGRRFSDGQAYRSFLSNSLVKKIPDLDWSLLDYLFQRTTYFQGNIDNPLSFMSIISQCHLLDYQEILFYLSTLPSLYTKVL